MRRTILGVCLLFVTACSTIAVHQRPRTAAARQWRMPVAGVTARQLVDTYGAPRDGGRRRHEGIDIFARRGTPVIAVNSGIVTINRNAAGGKCIYLTSDDGYVFYYAHLAGWRRGISDDVRVRRGDVIGYVGNSGNARGRRSHLHFEVHAGGRTLNPCVLLRRHSTPEIASR